MTPAAKENALKLTTSNIIAIVAILVTMFTYIVYVASGQGQISTKVHDHITNERQHLSTSEREELARGVDLRLAPIILRLDETDKKLDRIERMLQKALLDESKNK